MLGVWPLGESRLVQVRSAISSVDADAVAIGAPGPPDGKLWVITGVAYKPDVAETQVISFGKCSLKQGDFGIFNPVSLNLNPAYATFIEQGMEYLLFPGEYIVARRVTHTAGSRMMAKIQIIEIDQPLYTYNEPQVVKRQVRALSTIRSMIGAATPSARGGAVERAGGEKEGKRNPPV